MVYKICPTPYENHTLKQSAFGMLRASRPFQWISLFEATSILWQDRPAMRLQVALAKVFGDYVVRHFTFCKTVQRYNGNYF